MKSHRSKIEAVMRLENSGRFDLLPGFLFVLSVLYGRAVRVRSLCYDMGIARVRRLPCRVISIGNIAAGGTGKTPMTIYVAKLLQKSGWRPAVISRGYKGAAEKTGGVVSNGSRVLMDASLAGDEPYMMARRLSGIPLLVGKNRYEAGKRAVAQFMPDVIILDDGFQHRRLFRDIDLVLLDDHRFPLNHHLIPRGMLREPVSALMRADALILTRCRQNSPSGPFTRLETRIPGKPIFKTTHVPYGHALVRHARKEPLEDLSFLKTKKIFLFSGIAQNDEFAKMIANLAGAVCGVAGFPDHHPYSPDDLEHIRRRAAEAGADIIVTTEKDYVRLPPNPALGLDLAAIGVSIGFIRQEREFTEFIQARLAGLTNANRIT